MVLPGFLPSPRSEGRRVGDEGSRWVEGIPEVFTTFIKFIKFAKFAKFANFDPTQELPRLAPRPIRGGTRLLDAPFLIVWLDGPGTRVAGDASGEGL